MSSESGVGVKNISRKRTNSKSPKNKSEKPKRQRQVTKNKMAAKGANVSTGEMDVSSLSSPVAGLSNLEESAQNPAQVLAPVVGACGTKPVSMEDIMNGFRAIVKEQQVQMKTSIDKSLDKHSAEVKVSLQNHSAEVKDSVEAMKKIVTQQLSGYDAAMGKMVSETTKLTTTVTKNQIEMDRRMTQQSADMTAELDKLRAQLGPQRATSTRTPPKTPQRAYATTFDSEILIDGIPEERNECLVEVCHDRVFSVIGVNFAPNQIECALRVGREMTATDEEVAGPRRRPRSILVKFRYPSCKDVCIKRSYKLRGHRIFVNQHYSPRIERNRKRLYPILKKARQMEEYKDAISLEDDKIILNGKEIGVDDLDSLPDDIHPRDICTERRGGVTFFFRTDSPLSNHHMCQIELWGKKFNCVEQAYFFQKATICNDDWAKGRVMAAKHPGVQKGIGEKIVDNHDWESKKLKVMEQICGAKFSQNEHLMSFLQKTQGTLLAEDNPQDSYFGIGLSRNSPRSHNQLNFKSNHMGVILMAIRDNQS
jgi:hypothetical protein